MSNHECDKNCGRVQLLCESIVNVKPSMTKIVGERFKVTIDDYTTYSGNVVVKGYVEKLTLYLHEHDHKKDGRKKGSGCNEKDDMTYVKKSYYKQVDCVEGAVHYLESIMEFNAVVELPDVRCGNHCYVTAKVKDVGDFVAIEYDKKGHVTMGQENYVLDVKVCYTDHKSAKK